MRRGNKPSLWEKGTTQWWMRSLCYNIIILNLKWVSHPVSRRLPPFPQERAKGYFDFEIGLA